ncbi:MAG: hypothetical protein ACK5K7_02170 [Bacilli bacterium]
MKANNLKFIESVLKGYIVVGFLVCVVGILVMQTQLSILNLEFEENQSKLEELSANNSYLEMQKNESLTREKIEVFADENGLVTSLPNILDLQEDE